MASLLDLADARLRGLLDVKRQPRPSMAGLLGGKEPQGTLASTISGYTPPQMQAMSNQQVMDYARNVASSARQNLQNQMSDIDRALVMDQGGINVGDRQALARLMEQVPGLMGAVAYHGTPHTIRGKFDISKVGTGEGNQSYGYGMYFAENPKVASEYALTTPQNVNKEAYNAENIAKRLFRGGFDEEYITNRIKSVLPNANNETIATAVETAKTGKVGGNLYKVDVPDEYISNMLDWDKPLSKQPTVLQNIKNLSERPDLPKGFDKAINRALEDKFFDGQDLYYELTKVYKDPVMLAKAMEESGFKGIKYLDQGSRNPGFSSLTPAQLDSRIDGIKESLDAGLGNKEVLERQLKSLQTERDSYKNLTSNFVVFDPKDVKILERNKEKIGLLD